MFLLGFSIGIITSLFFAIWYGGVLARKQEEQDKIMFEQMSDIVTAQNIKHDLKRYEG